MTTISFVQPSCSERKGGEDLLKRWTQPQGELTLLFDRAARSLRATLEREGTTHSIEARDIRGLPKGICSSPSSLERYLADVYPSLRPFEEGSYGLSIAPRQRGGGGVLSKPFTEAGEQGVRVITHAGKTAEGVVRTAGEVVEATAVNVGPILTAQVQKVITLTRQEAREALKVLDETVASRLEQLKGEGERGLKDAEKALRKLFSDGGKEVNIALEKASSLSSALLQDANREVKDAAAFISGEVRGNILTASNEMKGVLQEGGKTVERIIQEAQTRLVQESGRQARQTVDHLKVAVSESLKELRAGVESTLQRTEEAAARLIRIIGEELRECTRVLSAETKETGRLLIREVGGEFRLTSDHSLADLHTRTTAVLCTGGSIASFLITQAGEEVSSTLQLLPSIAGRMARDTAREGVHAFKKAWFGTQELNSALVGLERMLNREGPVFLSELLDFIRCKTFSPRDKSQLYRRLISEVFHAGHASLPAELKEEIGLQIGVAILEDPFLRWKGYAFYGTSSMLLGWKETHYADLLIAGMDEGPGKQRLLQRGSGALIHFYGEREERRRRAQIAQAAEQSRLIASREAQEQRALEEALERVGERVERFPAAYRDLRNSLTAGLKDHQTRIKLIESFDKRLERAGLIVARFRTLSTSSQGSSAMGGVRLSAGELERRRGVLQKCIAELKKLAEKTNRDWADLPNKESGRRVQTFWSRQEIEEIAISRGRAHK